MSDPVAVDEVTLDGASLGRPVDVAVLQVALGASEYFCSRAIPPAFMPWFEG